jgi:subtilase family serine protease
LTANPESFLQRRAKFSEGIAEALELISMNRRSKKAKTTKNNPMKKVLTVFLMLSSVALTIVAFATPPGRTTLRGSKPSWATRQNYVRGANASDRLGFRVYLGWRDPAGAETLARAVSDPHSPSYGQYLTPEQFRQQFAPTADQVAQVQSWLTSQGFTLVYTPANNHYVSAKGSVGQARSAFGTSFGMYTVNGLTVRAPSADVSIPSSLAALVTGIAGLDQSAVFILPSHVVDPDAPPTAGFRNAPPLSTYYAELLSGVPVPPYTPPPAPPGYSFPVGFTDVALPSVPWTIRGYTPAQIKGAYGISGYDGAGQTVAIIDAYASPTILQDANQWSSNRGIPQFGSPGGGTFTQVVAPGVYNIPESPGQDPQGWYVEETLDVEAVHGMAPNANVVYVGSANYWNDLDAAMNHVVDNHLAQIVSNSYGYFGENLPPGYIKPVNDTFIQAAIEGIGIYFSTGDSGDNTSVLGYASTDWPASSPWVTAVGGTSLAVDASNTRVFETGWGVSSYDCNTNTLVCTRMAGFSAGSGGGVSAIFPEPQYQIDAGLTLTGRGVPDVAALGDGFMGMLVGQTQTFPATCNGPGGAFYDEYRVGGTSLSCPIVAGIMALSDQKAGFAHGFANAFFYSLGAGAFYDVGPVKTAVARRRFVNFVDNCNGTGDRLSTFDDYSGSPTQSTGAGWDNVTGLGVLNGIP